MSSPPVISELRNLGRRLKTIRFFHGVALLIAAAIAAMLAIISFDYFLHLAPRARIALLIIALALLGWLLIGRVALPTFRTIPLQFLATRIEQIFPQFRDRLRSTLDFTSENIPGSEAMKSRVIAETNDLFQQIDVRQAISHKPLYQSLTAAASALLAIILLAVLVNPFYRDLAIARFLHPFDSPAWPKTVQIELLDSLPVRIPVGQTLNIHMKLTRGDRASRKAILFYQMSSGPVQQQYLTRQPDGTYAASLDTRLDAATTGTLKTWITAGDDSVHLSPIAIVPRLSIQSITATIEPPAYAHLPPTTADLSQGPITATVGSRITLNVHFNKPLAATDPTIESLDSPAPSIRWNHSASLPLYSGGGPGWGSAQRAHSPPPLPSPGLPGEGVKPDSAFANWTLANSVRFHLHATDADGFANAAADEYQIITRTDALPVIQIENPRRNEERTPDAIIPLQLSASDDFGIAAVNLQITNSSHSSDSSHPSNPSHVLPLLTNAAPVNSATWTKTESTADQQRYRLDYAWPLAPLNLSPGDILEYHATAQDNFELPQKAPGSAGGSITLHHPSISSNSLRITIITQDQLSQNIADQMRQIADQIGQLHTVQTRTAQETQALSHDTAKKPKLDTADRAALDRLSNQQGSHAAEAEQLAGQLSDLAQRLTENNSPNTDLKQTATDAGQILNQAAEESMKQSAAALANLRDTPAAPAQRNPQFSQTQANQSQAADQLQRALDRLGSAGSLDQAIAQISSLLQSQQAISHQSSSIAQNNLGKTPDQMSPADQKRLAQNAADQKSLADRTAQTLAQMAKQSAALSKTDPDTAAALSQATTSADQQQITPSQQKAAESLSQNEQSDAQSAQSQAEIGLQTILSQLHEAQRQKLAELSRHLADLQAQLAHLIRRQAQHNLDNITLQGPSAPKNIDHQTLYGLAASGSSEQGRTAASSSPPTLQILTSSQEQTHRNTRDIAAAADKLQGLSPIASLLLQSADKMERAGVLLEQNQLPQAYDPPQSDALSLLLSAQKKLAKIKSDLDQKLAAASRQNLRATYIKIKTAQQIINDRTTSIAQSPRLPDGSLNRINAIALLQLPSQQKTLAEQIAALDDRLGSLGGIVYLWANKDIHDDMTTASTLNTLPTLPTLQPLQSQILTNLDAMIQSLSVEPKQDEFANRNAGGGSGKKNKKPHLPPEAELRLMRQFELNLKSQTALADQDHSPPQTLSSLAQRQSQLRSLLNQLLQKFSEGKIQLPPPPPNKNLLPEETKSDGNDDLANQLLTEKPAAPGNSADPSDPIPLLGNRMSRVDQRLALNHDPGQTTQTIEQNILKNLDQLIAQARQQQSQSSPQSQPQPQQNPQQNPQITKNPQQQPQATSTPQSATPARSSNVTGSAQPQTDLSQDIRQNMRQWGGLSERQRQAILEGQSDAPIEKYKSLIDDYYRTLAEQK